LPLGKGEDGEVVEVRVGRYGPFLSWGEKRVSVPDETPPDEITFDKAVELLIKGGEGPKSLGQDPKSGLEVFVKVGRFGPYFQLGEASQDKKADKPKMASLLKGMEPDTVTLDEALAVLSLPREVGQRINTETGEVEPILAQNGRFGPYLKCGKETRSIPATFTPLTVDLDTALKLLAEPKARGRKAAAAPLKELGPYPKSGAMIKLMEGRYGPYVTDGTTNASLTKDENAAELTLARAIELIASREGAPKKKKPGRKRATSKAGK
jgi:DNA topoisomerase-1